MRYPIMILKRTDYKQKRKIKTLSMMINGRKKHIRNIAKYEQEPLLLEDMVSGVFEYEMTTLREKSEMHITQKPTENQEKRYTRLSEMVKRSSENCQHEHRKLLRHYVRDLYCIWRLYTMSKVSN